MQKKENISPYLGQIYQTFQVFVYVILCTQSLGPIHFRNCPSNCQEVLLLRKKRLTCRWPLVRPQKKKERKKEEVWSLWSEIP